MEGISSYRHYKHVFKKYNEKCSCISVRFRKDYADDATVYALFQDAKDAGISNKEFIKMCVLAKYPDGIFKAKK